MQDLGDSPASRSAASRTAAPAAGHAHQGDHGPLQGGAAAAAAREGESSRGVSGGARRGKVPINAGDQIEASQAYNND